MKTLRVKSNKYKKTAIQFGAFLMKFNAAGIAEVDVADTEEELEFNKVVETYSSSICYLDAVADRELEAKMEGDIQYLNKTIEGLREELKAAKMVNEELATENVQLKAELKVYREHNLKDSKSKVEESQSSNKSEEEDIQKSTIRKALNKKNIEELKSMLNEMFLEFKSEWEGLTLKSDIVNYIVSKS